MSEKNKFKPIPIEKYINKGNIISTEEALKDIIPIDWSDDVLAGKYKGKTLIKSKNEKQN